MPFNQVIKFHLESPGVYIIYDNYMIIYILYILYIYTLGFRTRQKRRVHFETRGFKRKPEVFKIHEIE